MVGKLLLLFRARQVLLDTTKHDIKAFYASTILGLGWALLTPVLMLIVYGFVYSRIFLTRLPGVSFGEYLLMIFCGLVPFLHISECVTVSADALSQNKNLFKNTVFPVELIPVRSILSHSVVFAISLIMLLFSSVFIVGLHWIMLLLPVLIVLQFMFLIGMGWILSILNLVVGDVKRFLSFAIMVGMILSPIAYRLEMVPEKFRFVVWLNPFSYFVVSYQNIIVAQTIQGYPYFFGAFILGTVTFFLGFMFFQKVKVAVVNYAG